MSVAKETGFNIPLLETPKQVLLCQSKKDDKDQESIQSCTTPDLGYQWESDNFTIGHHK